MSRAWEHSRMCSPVLTSAVDWGDLLWMAPAGQPMCALWPEAEKAQQISVAAAHTGEHQHHSLSTKPALKDQTALLLSWFLHYGSCFFSPKHSCWCNELNNVFFPICQAAIIFCECQYRMRINSQRLGISLRQVIHHGKYLVSFNIIIVVERVSQALECWQESQTSKALD